MERGNIEQASQRGQRANEKERKQKEQGERERVLAEEIAAKKLKLNEPDEQISDISFAEEPPTCVDSSTQTEEFDYLVAGGPPQGPFCEDEFRNDDGLHSLDTFRLNFWLLCQVIAQRYVENPI